MKNNLINNSDSLIEKKIDWQTVQNEMKKKFGTDIFESWLKKIDLIDEFNSYILIAVPTRFIRDWIASRYLDQILSIVKTYKKEIIRIEFVINNDNNRLIDKVALEDNLSKSIESNVSFIKDSYVQYNRFDPNKNFENFIVGSSNKLVFEASKKVSVDIAH